MINLLISSETKKFLAIRIYPVNKIYAKIERRVMQYNSTHLTRVLYLVYHWVVSIIKKRILLVIALGEQ